MIILETIKLEFIDLKGRKKYFTRKYNKKEHFDFIVAYCNKNNLHISELTDKQQREIVISFIKYKFSTVIARYK